MALVSIYIGHVLPRITGHSTQNPCPHLLLSQIMFMLKT
uniref:Uncharacterized protein n=1 Tax=Anguilla anguilla TaxID=7936 RepID=A0A0E9RBP9_ANGAN